MSGSPPFSPAPFLPPSVHTSPNASSISPQPAYGDRFAHAMRAYEPEITRTLMILFGSTLLDAILSPSPLPVPRAEEALVARRQPQEPVQP